MTFAPSHPRAGIAPVLEALKVGDRDRAAALVADIVSADPPLAATWGSISRLALALGETALALTAAERHAAADHRDIHPRLVLAQMLAQNGRGRDAERVGRAVVADQPRLPAGWHLLGSCLSELGETDQAIAAFRRAVALTAEPASAALSLLAIAEAKRFVDPSDGDLEAMNRLAEHWPQAAPPENRAALLYALGKANDDLGRPDAAFAAYAEGAKLMAGLRAAPVDAAEAFVDQVVADFTADRLAQIPRSDVRGARPIFILGMPRSGTTLVEQILASHSAVAGGAELNLFLAAARPIGGFSADAVGAFASSRPDGLSSIGRAYLHMLDARFGAQGRVVDKTLNHSRFLGLIHRALPDARFIWLRREPGAVAWSCFRTWFAQGVDWSWSLEAIARQIRSEDRLHEHWSAVMGSAILTVPYEALVADADLWIPRILDHVDLPFEQGVRDFHQTDRVVNTASYAQVRRPMYTDSMEAWRRYEPYMKSFFDAYAAR